MSPNILDILPQELILEIIEIVKASDESHLLPDLNTLAQVNHTFHELANHQLYDNAPHYAMQWALVHNIVGTAEKTIDISQSVVHWKYDIKGPRRLSEIIGAFEDSSIVQDPDVVNEIYRVEATPFSALCVAAYHGSIDVVRCLLENGARQESDELYSEVICRKPLFLAAVMGHADVVQLLLDDSTCHLNAKDDSDISLLHFVVSQEQCDAAAVLLATEGIQLSRSIGFLGLTAFDLACQLENTTMINAFAYHSNTMCQYDIEYAIVYGICNYGQEDLVPALKTLLDKHDVRVGARQAALERACMSGSISLVEYLIPHYNADAHVQQDDNEQWSEQYCGALIYDACTCCPNKTKTYQIVKMLLHHGFDLNSKSPHHSSTPPLASAISSGNIPLVELLLDHGADIHFKNDDGWTIIHYLAHARDAMPGIVERVIQGGIDLSAADANNCTPLGVACQSGKKDPVEKILDAGVDIHICATGPNPHTALFYALCLTHFRACHDLDSLVAFLLQRGAPTTALKGERSPLHAACKEGRAAIVTMLLDHGADIEHEDEKGRTPLQLAQAHGRLACVEILTQRGAVVGELPVVEMSFS